MTGTVEDWQVMINDLRGVEIVAQKHTVVLPVTKEGRISLGHGLAELPYRSPLQYAMLEDWLRRHAGG